ncbi:hypothetical protein GCM10009608_73000 [Pseudonocardia alaniniphila]
MGSREWFALAVADIAADQPTGEGNRHECVSSARLLFLAAPAATGPQHAADTFPDVLRIGCDPPESPHSGTFRDGAPE